MAKLCDGVGVETWACVWRGKEKECLKPPNRIPYDFGGCFHQVYPKVSLGRKGVIVCGVEKQWRA